MTNPRHLYWSAWIFLWIILAIIVIPTFEVVRSQQIILLEWNLISVYRTPIILTVIADPTGIVFSCTVLFISANVLMFSTIYIKDDEFINRFTVLVLLFIISINLLIYLPHFIILLLGWDGLGIVSFILVIYYQNPKSLAAGIITALTNRIGDVILLLSIAWTLNQGHWLIINIWVDGDSWIQILCISVAAITKRAQIPFSRWLPAAIAAPTPVSALVHSSTLVTAGVFLLIRFYPFLHSIKIFNTIILIIAICTIIIAGIRATTECDIKKIIALSTLSQLGIIMTRIGLNIPNLAYFHMLTHALFKALLFICAGSFINLHLHTQDLRWMGNLSNQIPVATSCISLANIALCGFPFIAGFYSKDIIIEAAINMPNNIFIVLLAVIRIGLTSFYSIRFSLVTMWSSNSNARIIKIKEESIIIAPILFLSFVSILSGSCMAWLPPVRNISFILPSFIKILPIIIVAIGLILGWYITRSRTLLPAKAIRMPIKHQASCIIWFLVPLSSQFIIKAPLQTAHGLLKLIDQGWLEVYSGQGSNKWLLIINNTIIIHSPKTANSYLVTSSTLSVILILMIAIYFSC